MILTVNKPKVNKTKVETCLKWGVKLANDHTDNAIVFFVLTNNETSEG